MKKRSVDHLLRRLTKQLTSEDMPSHNLLMVTLGFNLVSIKPKQEVMEETPLCTGWMVFLNRAGNLAHVMHADDVNDYNRIRLAKSLKGASEEFIRKEFYRRMKDRYIF